MKKCIITLVLFLSIAPILSSLKLGGYVIWGNREERVDAFISRLEKKHKKGFLLMEQAAQGKLLTSSEQKELKDFSHFLKVRMERFDFMQTARPYLISLLVFLILIVIIFSKYIRREDILPNNS